MDEIRERTSAYCLENGMTNATLADALGMSRSSLYAKLRGLAPWGLEEAVKLAELLGMSVSEFAALAIKPRQ